MFILPNSIYNILFVFITGLNLMIFSHLIFCTSLSFFGLKKPRKDYELVHSKNKFLFLVPAHNEEAVIAATIQSLIDQKYDSNLYDIAIIADNCTDGTVEVINSFTRVKVFENYSKEDEPRGKPHAIAKFFAHNKWEQYDFIAFIDADNIVDCNYLSEMNSQIEKHPEFVAIQGYLGVKNVSSSFTASGYAAAYFTANRITQLANYQLGWNVAIGGTGFILSVDYLKENGWNPCTYTEDFELQVELAIKGLKTGWNHFAIIYDEKPNSLKASHKQRTRWAQGHWRVAILTTGKQLFSILKSKSLVEGMNRINTLFYSYSMIRPPIIMFVSLVSYLIDYRLVVLQPFLFSFIFCWVVMEVWNYLVIPLICFLQEGKFYFSAKKNNWKRILLYLRLTVAYIYNSVVYMFAQLVGFVTWFEPQNNWQKTDHSSSLEEVN